MASHSSLDLNQISSWQLLGRFKPQVQRGLLLMLKYADHCSRPAKSEKPFQSKATVVCEWFSGYSGVEKVRAADYNAALS